MGLSARVTSDEYEGLGEAVQAFYKQKGAEYVLQVDGIREHPTVEALSSAHERVKDRRDKLADKLEAFGDLTPEDVSEIQGELEELRESTGGDLISAEDLKELKDRQKELAQKAKRAEELESELDFYQKDQRSRLKSEIRGALSEQGVKPEAIPAVASYIVDEYDARFERGEDGFRPIVTGEINGVPGDHALSEFVGEWIESDGAAFVPASGKGGSGADPDGRSRSSGGVSTFDRNDPKAWGENAEAIAEGEAQAT